MSKWVVDASAILAFLNQETGQERVREILSEGAIISTINQSEIFSKLLDSGVPKAEINSLFYYLDLTIIDFNEQAAWETASFRSLTKALGLSV